MMGMQTLTFSLNRFDKRHISTATRTWVATQHVKYSERPMYPLYEDEGKEDDTGDPDKPTSRNWRPAGSPALNYNPMYKQDPVLQQIESRQVNTNHLYVGRPTTGAPGIGGTQSRLLRSNMDMPGSTRENWGQPVETECKQ